eukprot:CAMPEP_0202470318 /NCGR_PEP_ID=MMETSP1360-20130828/81274_1 /ASSEMBLY_ACC=CAM_ASM_000848 /TAXON_ID=515479 /ORGANISM="Licmophora paradoxa, Strain CCMP2313" /LENGTH=255 /DNA_ID=CAMNT_0049095983 /DNA_START=74 /DNA_END=841 /DNA_ORIENTATION=+
MSGISSHNRSHHIGNPSLLQLVIAGLILGICSLWTSHSCVGPARTVHPNSVYVPGGGFSGYWFQIGHLKTLSDLESKSFYCYSSGCLGVVAALSNHSLDASIEYAAAAQNRLKNGAITNRETVVKEFINDIVQEDTPLFRKPGLLSRIHIITAVPNGWMGTKSLIRSPSNANELKEWLLESAWIPWAIGNSMWYQDSFSGGYHMDGVFSLHDHPVCAYSVVPMSLDWDMRLNTLNVNMGRSKAERFWYMGLSGGN